MSHETTRMGYIPLVQQVNKDPYNGLWLKQLYSWVV